MSARSLNSILNRVPFQLRTYLSLGLVAVLMAATGVFSHEAMQALIEGDRWINHTREVTEDLGRLSLLLATMQSNARGYFITGQSYYIEHRQEAVAEIPAVLARLRAMTSDNPEQQRRLDAFDKMLADRARRWREVSELFLEKGFPAIRERMRSEEVKARAEASQELINGMITEEKRLLELRTARSKVNAQRAEELNVFGGVAAILIAFYSIWLIFRQMNLRRKMEDTLRGVIESAPVGIASFDLDGRVNLWSPACESMFGWSQAEVLGRPAPSSSPEEAHALDDFIQEMRKTGKRVEAEVDRRRKDGTAIRIGVSAIPLLNDANVIQGFMAVLRDVTERSRIDAEMRSAKEAATRANRLKSDFLANMSHEIRTPLNGIIGMTELLLEGSLEDTARKYVRIVHESSDRLLAIVNDILDFSKIEAGKMVLESSEYDPVALVESQVELLASQARTRGLALTTFFDPKVPRRLKGDPGRTGQIIINLLGNAIKFTPSGTVTIRVEPTIAVNGAPMVKFSVVDTGVGLSEEQRGRVFSPFTQADGSTARKYGGTGLGLSICRRLVILMGGEIDVVSSEGSGATFWFTVPALVVEDARVSQAPALPSIAVTSSGAGPARILVAEDNPVNQLLVTTILKKLGYTVEAAVNGREVLIALGRAKFDLILMDCQMPEMDGFEATREIRRAETKNGGRLPIVALTANVLPEDRQRCLDSGMDDHLPKPIKKDLLAGTVARWLELRKAN